jgi:hypothetical protein
VTASRAAAAVAAASPFAAAESDTRASSVVQRAYVSVNAFNSSLCTVKLDVDREICVRRVQRAHVSDNAFHSSLWLRHEQKNAMHKE